MKNKYVFVLVMLICIFVASIGLTTIYVNNTQSAQVAKEEDDIKIVTSFYPMYVATINIVDGIDGVTLENLSEPQTGCLHDFQMTPEDMKLLSTADVFVINGGGIEGFMSDVAKAYPNLQIVEACENLTLLSEETHEEAEHDEHNHSHESGNAHAWMSIKEYRTQVETIAKNLAKLDSKNANAYLENAKKYDEKLKKLQEEQEEIIEIADGMDIIIFHEAYEYVASDYHMNVSYLMDLDEERQVSAGEVADVISAIDENDVSIILAEEQYGKSMAETVSKETNVSVIYIDALNRGDYDKDSYIEGMSNNIKALSNILKETLKEN